MTSPALLLALTCWIVVFAWCCTEGVRLLRAHRQDAAALLGLTAAAAALRLRVPWGTIDQAEADRARLMWQVCSSLRVDFATVRALAAPLLLVGVEPWRVYHWVALFVGVSTVVATYALARALGLARPLATLAGCIVLMWPAHVRYSGTLGLNVVGGTIWAGTLAAVIMPRTNPVWRTRLLAAFIGLLVYTREEFRSLVPLLGIVLLTKEWKWRERFELVGLVLIGVFPYLSRLAVREHPQFHPTPWFDTLFNSPGVTPNLWCYLGVAGLVAGRLSWRNKALLLSISLALFTLYSFFGGGEYNPIFGVWRYYLSFLPMLAVGAAALVAWLPLVRGVSPAWALALLTVVSVARYWHVLTRPVDVQAQFTYLLETTPKIAETYKTLLVVGKARGEMGDSTPVADAEGQGIGLATRLVPPVVQKCEALNADTCLAEQEPFQSPAHWHHRRGPQAAPVSLSLLTQRCAGEIDLSKAALFVGLNQSSPELAAMREKYRLEPIDERAVSVAVLVPNLTSACGSIDLSARKGSTVSDDLPDCSFTMGWYRLTPKTP
jgi:hypothetical protein